MIGDAETAADYVRYVEHRVDDQISIFSAISIASSTSMPRYRASTAQVLVFSGH
ncbi:MAG: hypothetical protein AB1749_01510 [Pseudomonadota bacterium]